MKNFKKQLKLRKETIRKLSRKEAKAVAGGLSLNMAKPTDNCHNDGRWI